MPSDTVLILKTKSHCETLEANEMKSILNEVIDAGVIDREVGASLMWLVLTITEDVWKMEEPLFR